MKCAGPVEQQALVVLFANGIAAIAAVRASELDMAAKNLIFILFSRRMECSILTAADLSFKKSSRDLESV